MDENYGLYKFTLISLYINFHKRLELILLGSKYLDINVLVLNELFVSKPCTRTYLGRDLSVYEVY